MSQVDVTAREIRICKICSMYTDLQDLIRSLFRPRRGKLIVSQNLLCRNLETGLHFFFYEQVPRVSDRYAQGSRTPGCQLVQESFLAS